jgi:hypothetical protein
MKKIFWKFCILFLIWAVTCPLGWVVYPYYYKWDFALMWGYGLFDQYIGVWSRHFIGYFVLGFAFKWLALPMAIMDEVIQLFIKGKSFSWIQMIINVLSALLGIGILNIVKLTFMNPFKKKELI